jgi:hypothetical protein
MDQLKKEWSLRTLLIVPAFRSKRESTTGSSRLDLSLRLEKLMTTKNLNEKKIIQVKNVSGCTNFGGLEMVGNKMYTIKTRSDNQLSVISEYPDYRKTKRTNHKFASCMNHGNDIAYNAGYLYVAPCDKFIERVSVKDWSHKRLSCNIFLSGIAHWGENQFIGLSSSSGPQYTLALLEPRGSIMAVLTTWKVNNPKHSEGFSVSQGLGVKKSNKRIFVVFTNQDFHRNVILRSAIYSSEVDYILNSKSSSGKYELEGIGFRSDGYKIIGSNLPDGQDATFLAK